MIPVLGVPTLTGRIEDMLASVDAEVGQTIVVDQGSGARTDRAHVITLPHNIGVGTAWNLILKVTPTAPWWAIVNDDVVFARGDLARLEEAMADPSPRLVLMGPGYDGFAAYGINRAALERVGYFDENFVPAYFEDCDYEYRCGLAHVPVERLPAELKHARSSTLEAEPRYKAENARTYPLNREYYIRKWGGNARGGETHQTPFASGVDPSSWILDAARRRELDWT